MAKDEENKIEKEPGVGLVTLQGEIGLGIKLPNGDVIELTDVPVGLSQALAYLVTEVSEIKKNIS